MTRPHSVLWGLAILLAFTANAHARKKKKEDPTKLKHYVVRVSETSGDVVFKAVVYNKVKEETKKLNEKYIKEVKFYQEQVRDFRSDKANRGKKYPGDAPRPASMRTVSGKLSYADATKIAAAYNEKQKAVNEARKKKEEEAAARREKLREKREAAKEAAAKEAKADTPKGKAEATKRRKVVVDKGDEEEEEIEGEDF